MHRRHHLGKRRVALAGGAVYALSRAFAYTPWGRSTPIQEPILMGVAGGVEWLLWVYIAAWAVAGLWCLWNMRHGELLGPFTVIVSLCAAWSTAWCIGWVWALSQGVPTTWWQTVLTYAGPAIWTAAMVGLIPRVPFLTSLLSHPSNGEDDPGDLGGR